MAKTAWRMAHELRKRMAAADYDGPLSGWVEADENYIGGRQHGRRKRDHSNKTILMGLVERNGSVRAGPVPDVASVPCNR